MPLLDWLTRDDDLGAADRVPYRLMEDVPELSHGNSDQLLRGKRPVCGGYFLRHLIISRQTPA